jgi:hypothetical protein
VHVAAAEDRQLVAAAAAIALRQRQRRLAVVHRVLMARVEQLLLVFEKLIKRRLAGVQRRGQLIHRCVVKTLAIEGSCGLTDNGLAAPLAKRVPVE